MRVWQGCCKNSGVAGFIYECGSGSAYVRVREWQGVKKIAVVAGFMQEPGSGRAYERLGMAGIMQNTGVAALM